MILRALMLSIESLSDRRILMVFGKSLLVTLLIFAAAGFGLWSATNWAIDAWIKGSSYLGYLAEIAAFIIWLLAAWLLWRVIAIAVIWFFSDDIVIAVEQQHYPHFIKSAVRPNIMQSGGMAMRSIGRALLYNLIALPVYLLLLITGVGTAIAFLLVNAVLLGRDLEDMITARHGIDYGKFPNWARWLLGLIGTGAMLLPIINLVVPVVATAMAVHMTHMKKPA
jgi:CysZ protein